jgi:hypothetical protein
MEANLNFGAPKIRTERMVQPGSSSNGEQDLVGDADTALAPYVVTSQ